MLSKLLVGILAALSCSTIYFLHDAYQWLEHTHEVIDNVHESRRLLLETQDSVRGYLISHQDFFLVDYNSYYGRIMPSIDKVEELTKDNPVQQKNVRLLRNLVSDKVTRIYRNITMASAGNFEGAIVNIREGQGEKLSQSIDIQTQKIIDEERKLLVERKLNVEIYFAWATYGIPVLFLSILIFNKLGV